MQKPDKANATGLVRFNETKDRLIITFPYNANLVMAVKRLSDRRWHSEQKHWSADVSIDNITALQTLHFVITPDVIAYLNENQIEGRAIARIPAENLPEGLRSFQVRGVEWLQAHNGRGLLADEMGLGKTIQALGWLYLNKNVRPAIIVCPASLKLNWEREACKWLPRTERIVVVNGKRDATIDTATILIINYDILAKRTLPKAKAVILDEAHYTKNSTAQRTKAAQALCAGVAHVIALTGTPILNRPIEIFNTVQIIAPAYYRSFFHFARRYCGAKYNGYGWDFTGASNTQELNELLTRTVMLRRLKKDVLTELPAKQRSIVPIQVDGMDEYQHAEADFISWLRRTQGQEAAARASIAEALTRIEGLKQLAAKGKLTGVIDWVDNFLEADKKLVLFTTHKQVLSALVDAFPGISVSIEGATTAVARQAAVDAFQNDSGIRLFIGNLQAAGVGLTLTAADTVAFVELGWTPGAMIQAEDRVHRIGQTENVNIYYLVAYGTIEEQIAVMLNRKADVLAQVLDGAEENETSLLADLMTMYHDSDAEDADTRTLHSARR